MQNTDCLKKCASFVEQRIPTIPYDDYFYPILFEDYPVSIHDSDVILLDAIWFDGESDALHCSCNITPFRPRVKSALGCPHHDIPHRHSGFVVVSLQARTGNRHFTVLMGVLETREPGEAHWEETS